MTAGMEGSHPQGVVQTLPVGFYTRGIIPGKIVSTRHLSCGQGVLLYDWDGRTSPAGGSTDPSSRVLHAWNYSWKIALDDGKSNGRSAGIEILLLEWTPQKGSFYIFEPTQHVNSSNRIVYPDVLLIFKCPSS
jgi:hypothetical protein